MLGAGKTLYLVIRALRDIQYDREASLEISRTNK